MNTEVKLFDITDQAIDELKKRYSDLKINGIDDKEGYKTVSAARKVMKGYRVDVDKRRKELTEDALKHQRTINAEAKRITERLHEIEDYLSGQEKLIDDAVASIKAEEQRKIELMKQDRIDVMLKVGFRYNGSMFTPSNGAIYLAHEIFQMDEDKFNALIVKNARQQEEDERKRAELQAEQGRKAAEAKAEQERVAAALKAEQEKLAEMKRQAEAELSEQRAKLAAEQAEAEAVREMIRQQEESLREAVIRQEQKELNEKRQAEQIKEDIKIWENPAEVKTYVGVDMAEPGADQTVETVIDNRDLKNYTVNITGDFEVTVTLAAMSEDEAFKTACERLQNDQLFDIQYNLQQYSVE